MKPAFKPANGLQMPAHVLRAFFNNGRQPAHTMAHRLNGFYMFTDRESSTQKTTTWVCRSAPGKGVRFWSADMRHTKGEQG